MVEQMGIRARTLLLGLLIVLGAALVAGPAPLHAQEPAGTAQQSPAAIDYEEWQAEAGRVESLVEAATASTAFLQNVRSALVERRTLFQQAQSLNASRIRTVQAQIETLGPPPAEGATEPEAIAAQRAALNAELAELEAPRVRAAAALTRTEGLIEEIDELLRQRQQEQFLQLDPSPLNPANWPTALAALVDVAMNMEAQLENRRQDPILRERIVDQAPLIVVLTLIGLLAIARGPQWTYRMTERLQARAQTRGRVAVAFLVSLLQITVPLVGFILLLVALIRTGMVPPQGMELLSAFGALAVHTYIALWLARRVFRADSDGVFATLSEQPGTAASARQLVVLIGVMTGAAILSRTIAEFDQVSPAAQGVIQFPALLFLGLFFWRFARILRAEVAIADAPEGSSIFGRVLAVSATALVALAVGGPLLAAIGYVNASEALMVPAAQTLGVIGILLALQPVVRDLYAVVTRGTMEDAQEALVPVLVGFLLVFVALPAIALIWSVRPDQLADIYMRFWEGVDFGGVRITPGNVFAVAVVFGIGLIVVRLLQGALKSTVLPRTRLDSGARTAVVSGVGYVGIALAAVIAITAGGIDLTALGVVLGALSVGIGFGLQNVVNNFVSGIILLIERPISEGDWIEVNGTMGIVKDISVRSTRIETFDRTDVIVPNGDFISGTVTNWTRGNTVGRAIVTVGVAYGTDTRRVQEILLEIAREHPVVAAYPEPGVDFLGFGADSLDFRIRAILRDVNQMLSVKTEMHHRIAERFAEEGIEIPFAQRDIWLRNPEALREPRSGETGEKLDTPPMEDPET